MKKLLYCNPVNDLFKILRNGFLLIALLIISTNGLYSQSDSIPTERYYLPTATDPMVYSEENLRFLLEFPATYIFESPKVTTYSPTRNYYRYSQKINDLPVIGGEFIVQVDNGNITKVVNHFRSVDNTSSTVAFTEEFAIEVVKQDLLSSGIEPLDTIGATFQSDLVYFSNENKTELCHAIHVDLEHSLNEVFYVSAEKGDIVYTVNNIYNCEISGTCETVHEGNQPIYMTQNGGNYNLHDCSILPAPGFKTLNVLGQTNLENAVEYQSSTTDWNIEDIGERTGLDVHWGTKVTLEYLTGKGIMPVSTGGLTNYSNFGNNWYNAEIWLYPDKTFTKYPGDYPDLVAIDVVGHELGHGVCYYMSENGILQGGG